MLAQRFFSFSCPKLGSPLLSVPLFPVLPALFALLDILSLLLVKWCMHYWEIMPDKFTVLKATPQQIRHSQRLVAAFLKSPLGRDFLPWLLNYHLYLFESWVFRNGLNQWNKKGRCLLVFWWVLKKSLQALQNDGLASCLKSWLLVPSHYYPQLTNNMDFPDNSYLAEILFKTEPSFNLFLFYENNWRGQAVKAC